MTSNNIPNAPHTDEDWNAISDLAEGKRLQNRSAQEDYRTNVCILFYFVEANGNIGEKLKGRIEDLEQRAGPIPEAPEKLQTSQQQPLFPSSFNPNATSAPIPVT